MALYHRQHFSWREAERVRAQNTKSSWPHPPFHSPSNLAKPMASKLADEVTISCLYNYCARKIGKKVKSTSAITGNWPA